MSDTIDPGDSNRTSFFQKYGKIVFGSILIVILLMVIGVWIYSGRTDSIVHSPQNISSGEVSPGYSEDASSQKITYDTRVLTIALDTPIDSGSINTKNVTLSPSIEGTLSVSPEGKKVSYMLSHSLSIGESYELRIASTVKKSDGTTLGKDAFVTFLATPAAQAVKIFPSGTLDALSQNITVVFNTPMVPLTNLEERDRLPCPLKLSPMVEGKCVWTNSSILEYIPKNPLQGATHYRLQVANAPGLLHTLSGTLTGEIMTTPLKVMIPNTFSPQEGIMVTTNFPVSLENLIGALDLTDSGGVHMESIVTPVKTENRSMSETSYTIMPKNQTFFYQTNYILKVRTSLRPKYGTEPLLTESITALTTNDFASVEPYQNIYDNSGILIDTKSWSYPAGSSLPNTHIFFRVSFDHEVPLDTSSISLRSTDGIFVEFDMVYGKKDLMNASGAVIGSIDDKTVLKITPRSPLKKNANYTLVILRKIDPALPSDQIVEFHTATELKLSALKLISNTLGCIYANNQLGEGSNETDTLSGAPINTVPASRKPSYHLDNGRNIWDEKGKTYTVQYECPQIAGQNAYMVDLRLNPKTKYTIDFLPSLLDEYDQGMREKVSFSLTTLPIDEKDIYLYSSAQSSETQVIPSSLPIVLGVLSVNADDTNIDVCEMDQTGYISFLIKRNNNNGIDATPQCLRHTTKKIDIKNHFWSVTPTKIDLEKDILKQNLSTPYVYIRGSVGTYDSHSQRSFTQMFIRSNLALTLENSSNVSVLFASSYDGKNIPSDLNFEVYRWDYTNSSQGILTKGGIPTPIIYNAAKKVYTLTDTGSIGTIAMIVARNATYFGILNLGQDQTSNYDFKYISGMDASSRDLLYLYSDRPLYQPGDTVYFKGILRSFHFDGYHPSAVRKGTLNVIGGQGSVSGDSTIASMDMTIDENSNFHGQFTLPKSAPQGRYAFGFTSSGSENNPENIVIDNNAEFFLESYKKPVFKVTAEAPKSDVMIGDSVDIRGHSEYYFGGILGGAPYQYSILSQSYYFDPKEYRDYSFSKGSAYMDCLYWGACEYHDSLLSSGTGVLDTRGNALIHHTYSTSETTGEQLYTYSLEVTDPDTRKTVNQNVSQIVHTTDAYVGIKSPYWNSGKTGANVDGVVIDSTGKPLGSKKVLLQLVKREWKNVKKEGVDGIFYNDGMLEETLIDTINVMSDSKGEFKQSFSSATGGEYEIRASYTGSNQVAFVSSTTIYASGDGEQYWYEGNNAITDITPDKTLLAVGDRAGFTLKTPMSSGKMLVSIEKDDGILDYFVQDITNTTSRITFDIPETYIPNVYVKVFVLGQNSGELLPTYKRALSVIKVLPDPKKLSVTVTAEKQKYLPGESVKVNIHVTDINGKALAGANGSLSIVDESLLALAGNPLKNPFAYFYDMKRYLAVNTYTSLLNLVAKLEVKDVSQGEKGGAGDGQKGGLSKKKRGTFKDTAFWQSDFTTNEEGNYILTIPALPDNLTTWIIEAIINTRKSEVGIGITHIQTSKNVLINDNLPRFLGTSDRVEIAPVIFNKTNKDSIFDITLNANNVTLNTGTQSVDIKAGAQLAVLFNLSVDSIEQIHNLSPKASHITIHAVSRITGDEDTLEMTIPIIETTTREMVSTSGRADPMQDEKIILKSTIRKNGGLLTIHYAATLLPGLLSGLEFLAQYPYGCIEQKLSAIMPQVYMKELSTSIGAPYDLSTMMVQKYISKEKGYSDVSMKDSINDVVMSIANYQSEDGGFSYWTDPLRSDISLTLSVLSRLQDLSRIGFSVPGDVQAQASKYVKSLFYSNQRPYCTWTDCSYSLHERLDMIIGVLDASPYDYDAYKMYQTLGDDIKKENTRLKDSNENSSSLTSTDWLLSEAHLLLRLSEIKGTSTTETQSLISKAKVIVRQIANEAIVTNPRGSFIGRSDAYTRLPNTLAFVEIVNMLGGDILSENQTILDQMNRWIISQKKSDGSWGSTAATLGVIRTITTTERMSGNIKNTDLIASLSLDTQLIGKNSIGSGNVLETFTKSLSLDTLKDSSNIHFEKTGSGRLYYDIALEYILGASGMRSRDEGFSLEGGYYDYNEYHAIEKTKNEEWSKYEDGKILYTDLKYSKDVVEYVKPLTSLKVGSLVLAYNRMILAEPRDQLAFEGFIPSGAELVNPNLKTESQNVTQSAPLYSLFEHEEWQDDRYFATTSSLDAGIYTFHYIFRPTHSGTYELRPSRVSEFYHPEVFGRTAGRSIVIVK